MNKGSLYTFLVVANASLFIILMTGGSPVYALQSGNGSNPVIPRVWDVEIEGNKTFSDLVIKQVIATEAPPFFEKLAFWNNRGVELDEMEIRRDVERIRRYYQRRGFPRAVVRHQILPGNKEWQRKVRFVIDENAPILIERVVYRFRGDSAATRSIRSSRLFRRAVERNDYQVGKRFQQISEPDIIGELTGLMENQGYAFANVDVSAQIDSLETRAAISIELAPGPITYFDQIEVSGAESISEEYVVRESGLKRGGRYSEEDVQQAQREIFNHHLFRFATINLPPQPQDSTLNFEINLREHPLRSVQATAGVGTEDLLRGQVSWTHRNLFRQGHRLTTTGRVSFIEQSATLDYLFPYIFNTKSSVVISPFLQHLLERRIYELFHGGVTNSFIYRYRDDLTGTFSYQFSRNLELSTVTAEVLPDTTFQYDLSSFQVSGYYSPGYTNREQRGWVIQPYLELSGLFGAAEFSFNKASIDIRKYARLSETTTLAARVKGGGIFRVAQDSLPQNIRYYLGGTSSIRGWGRNELGPQKVRLDSTGAFYSYDPVGGQAQFGFNLEVRQTLNSFIRGLGLAVFLDGGQVWRSVNHFDARSMQFSVGGGLRYRSPIGPIRIDVGYKLNPTDEDLNIYRGVDYGSGLDRMGIHFSVGQAF